MKVGFVSLGCAKNLVDSEHIIALFDDPFFEYEYDLKKCDAIVINTCGFILSAKEEAIDTILEIAEYKKGNLKKLIVTGCFVQRYFLECKEEFPEVDLFVRLDQYDQLGELLSELFEHKFSRNYGTNRKLVNNSHTAYLKISDGCYHYCAFCAIPLIRGKYHSYPMEEVLEEARFLEKQGVKELNLVAQDTTCYGIDLYHEYRLKDLLRELNRMDFRWIRILYMYPDEIDKELLQAMKECDKVLPYFDIPIQYGNDRILELMNRKGDVALIKDKIKMIRSYFKEPIIRTTLIVGFPQEDAVTFSETMKLVEELQFDSLGAFTFSPEEDTKAYEMEGQVEETVKQARYDLLMSRQQEIVLKKNESRVGKVYDALVERYESLFDRYVARTYMSAPDGIDGVVYIRSEEELKIGEIYTVKITGYDHYDLTAIIK